MARCQRDYDPTIGRFTSLDPAKDRRGDGDLYDYCQDDPVSRVDPTGLWSKENFDDTPSPAGLTFRAHATRLWSSSAIQLPTFPAQAANVLAGNIARRMLKPSRANGPGPRRNLVRGFLVPVVRNIPPASFSFRLLSEAARTVREQSRGRGGSFRQPLHNRSAPSRRPPCPGLA